MSGNEKRVVLTIQDSRSNCEACRRNADWRELSHYMATMVGEGCGATFTHVLSPYRGSGARVRAMRPDLIYIGLDPLPEAEPNDAQREYDTNPELRDLLDRAMNSPSVHRTYSRRRGEED